MSYVKAGRKWHTVQSEGLRIGRPSAITGCGLTVLRGTVPLTVEAPTDADPACSNCTDPDFTPLNLR